MATLIVEQTDVRRILVATALTVIALPFLLTQHRSAGDRAVAAVGPAAGLAASASAGNTAASNADTTAVRAAILGGPAATTSPAPEVIEVAVPAPSPPKSADGKAGFRRWAAGSVGVTQPCATPAAPVRALITVTDIDNGHAAKCVNVGGPVPKGQLITLDTAVFEQLTDLAQAPIPVHITW